MPWTALVAMAWVQSLGEVVEAEWGLAAASAGCLVAWVLAVVGARLRQGVEAFHVNLKEAVGAEADAIVTRDSQHRAATITEASWVCRLGV